MQTDNKVISEQGYIDAAKKLNCEVAVIKAVAKVESSGSGYLPNGDVKILFEPHVFWRCLMKKKITPVRSDICYPSWGTLPYGLNSAQHERMEKAAAINRECALMAASWGGFQILGENYLMCGCKTVNEFVVRMNKSADEQLILFCEFVKSAGADDELRGKKWSEFSLIYNGKGYAKNKYDIKLAQEYAALTKK